MEDDDQDRDVDNNSNYSFGFKYKHRVKTDIVQGSPSSPSSCLGHIAREVDVGIGVEVGVYLDEQNEAQSDSTKRYFGTFVIILVDECMAEEKCSTAGVIVGLTMVHDIEAFFIAILLIVCKF